MIEGTKTETVKAPAERVWEIISDFERYPEWHPFFSTVEVTERDGEQRVARAKCTHGTPVGDLHTEITVAYDPQISVKAARAGGDLDAMSGQFTLDDQGKVTVVTHHLIVDPGFKLGLLLRGSVEDRVRNSVLNGALDGIARQAAAGG